jgi:hypothetical protein
MLADYLKPIKLLNSDIFSPNCLSDPANIIAHIKHNI